MCEAGRDNSLMFPNQLSYEINMTQINETSYGKLITPAVTDCDAEHVTSMRSHTSEGLSVCWKEDQ